MSPAFMYRHTAGWGGEEHTNRKRKLQGKKQPAIFWQRRQGVTEYKMSSSEHRVYFKQNCVVTILGRDSEKQTSGFVINLLENCWQILSDLTCSNNHLYIIWVCLYMYIERYKQVYTCIRLCRFEIEKQYIQSKCKVEHTNTGKMFKCL